MIILKLATNGLDLIKLETSLVTSDNKKSISLEVTFDDSWTGYGKSATFKSSSSDKIYEVPLADNACVVPWEVLESVGTMSVGVRGVKNDGSVIASDLVDYKIAQGAKTGDGTSEDPTPTVYEQLLSNYGSVDQKITKEIQDRANAIAIEKSERMTEVDVERKRIDNIVKLPSGSTSGDAELMDIRIGVDGTTYDSAGTAVREQISSLKEDLSENEKILWENVSEYTTRSGYVNDKGIPITDTNIGNHTSFIIIPSNVTDVKVITDAKKLMLPATICFYNYTDYRNFVSYEKFYRDMGVVSIPKGASYFIVNCNSPDNLHIFFNKIKEEPKKHVDLRDFLPAVYSSKTDVSEALQKAVDFCHENFIPLYIPNKNFLVKKQITVYPNTHIIGDGIYGETKQCEPDIYTIKYAGKGTLFSSIDPTASLMIDGCIFVGNNKSNKCIFINGETSVVKNCTFYSFLNGISVSNTKGGWTGEIKIHDNIFAIGYSGITVSRKENLSSDINDWEIYNNIFISNSISFECDFAVALKYYNNHDYSKAGIVIYNNAQHFEIFNNYFDNDKTSIKTPFSGQLNTISGNVFLLHIENDTNFSAIITSNNHTSNAFVQISNNLVSGNDGIYTNGAFITISDDFSNDNALTVNHFGNNFKSLANGIVNHSSRVNITNFV